VGCQQAFAHSEADEGKRADRKRKAKATFNLLSRYLLALIVIRIKIQINRTYSQTPQT
jgi:hypothetical protein